MVQRDKPWYDRRSKELNSLLNNPHNTNEIKALENIVDGIPIVDDYSVNNSHGFLDYARHIASNIFSHVPTPVKMGFATGLIAVVAACSSGSVPTATPTNTPAPPSRATPAPTITITFLSPEELVMTPQASEATDLSTYKIIFPFKEPSSSLEEYVLNNTNVLTYMKFVRAKTDFTWAVSLANLVNQSINPLNWIDFFGKNKELSDLIPYIPREDIPIYQQSQPNYQGTKVEAKPVYFQQTATGELIPLENPDMDEQSFEELKKQYLSENISYDQNKILFLSTRDRNGEIYVINADGSELKRLTNSPFADNTPSWSPDGKKIAFTSGRDGNFEIYVMNADGSELKNLTNNTAWDDSASWSPYGDKITFQSDRDGDFDIYVMNADGSELKRLTTIPGWDAAPSWSPDGKKIAFTSDWDGNFEIYVINADGSELKKLTNSSTAESKIPIWSPDGKKIAFEYEKDRIFDIYVMNADGSGLENLTNNPAWDNSASWSPDGKKIVFDSTRDGNREIYIMNADGSGLKNLTNNPEFDRFPVWSPDGKKIAFQSGSSYRRDGNFEIYVMNADGSGLKRLTNNSAHDGQPIW